MFHMKTILSKIKLLLGLALNKPLIGPNAVSIETTHQCNYRCLFCESHGSRLKNDILKSREYFKNKTVMEFYIFQNLIDDLYKLGTRKIALSGKGEPLMHPEFIKFISYAKQKGMHCTVFTNGTLINQELLKKIIVANLDELNISLNAASEEVHKIISGRNEYSEIIECIKEISRFKNERKLKNPKIILSNVIFSKNYKEIENMLSLGKELSVNEIVFSHVGTFLETADLGLTPEIINEIIDNVGCLKKDFLNNPKNNLSEFLRGLKICTQSFHKTNKIQTKLPCYAAWIFAVISPDGTVRPCCYCEDILGNLYHQSFSKIWKSTQYRYFRKMSKNLHKFPESISSCKCFTTCNYWKYNLYIYNKLHPFSRISLTKI